MTLFQYRLAGGQSGKFQCAVRCGTDMVTDKVTVTVPSPGQYCHIISMLQIHCDISLLLINLYQYGTVLPVFEQTICAAL